MSADSKQKYLPLIASAETKFGVPQNLLLQLISQESRFREDVISGELKSSAGAVGIAQFMPDTASEWAEKLGIPEEEKNKPERQIMMAGAFLGSLLKKYKNNSNPNISKNATAFAFAEYNAGATKLKSALELAKKGLDFVSALPKETQKYIQPVTKISDNITDVHQVKDASATKSIFLNFNKLESNIEGLKKLPIKATQDMAAFLIGVGKGKIVLPKG